MKRVALSYWVLALAGAILFELHGLWWRAFPDHRGEVVSGFGAALIVLGVVIGSRPYIQAGIRGTAEAQVQAPQFMGYGDSAGNMIPETQAVYHAKVNAVEPDVWAERVVAVLVVILGTLLNSYGAPLVRVLGF